MHDKITFGVLTYDSIHNKQGGIFMWQSSPEQQGNCHRSALLAGQLATKSHTADCLLFKKEDNFCMTLLVSPWLANPEVVGQMVYKFSIKLLLHETKYSK